MRKGQLGNLQGLVITLVVVGIVLGVGLYVLAEFQDIESIAKSATAVGNETLTTVTEVGERVARSVDPAFSMSTATVVCHNNTDFAVISTNNYTSTSDGWIYFIGVADDTGWNNSDWDCNYTFTYGESAYVGINKTVQAINKIPVWLAILVIIAIVGIVMAILFAVFPSGGGGSGAGKGFGKVGFGGRDSSGGTAEI